jgi:hypothetical protein
MKQTIFLTIFFLTTIFSYGQKEHLEPARDFKGYEGVLKMYYDNVFPLLYSGFQEKPYAQYTSMPSFSNEYAFSVELKDNKYFVVSNTLSESYWYATDKKKVKLITRQTEISEGLFKKTGDLFQILSEQTKNPEKEIMGLDGETYYFSTTDKKGEIKIGETWSPNENSLLDKLVKICDNLFSVETGKNISQTDIEKEIEQLISDLNN